jgi:glucokinase
VSATESRTRTTEDRFAIGFDVGGTKIAVGVVTGAGRIIHRQLVPTPHRGDPAVLRYVLTELATDLRSRYPAVTGIGVGAAGMVDWPSGHIRWAPNNTYRDLPLQQALTREIGLPSVVENDANAAAWAEARIGAGVGHRDAIVITVGTGIGGGIILDGRLHRGRTGIGGEVGHLVVAPGTGHRCGCGVVGCLEAMASGTALGRAGRLAAQADPTGKLAAIAGSADKVTGETVFQAARLGDPGARELFDQLGYWLGAGIASLVTLFDPEIVIMGGGLITTGDLLLIPTRTSFQRFVFAREKRKLPPILPARLGADAGVIGAALLALDRHAESPRPDAECIEADVCPSGTPSPLATA